MRQVTGVDEVVDHIEDAARYGIEAQLRADGGVMAPTVFILLRTWNSPSWVSCPAAASTPALTLPPR